MTNELHAAVEAARANKDLQAAANALGIARTTLHGRLARAVALGIVAPTDATPEAIPDRERLGYTDQIRQLRTDLRKAQRDANTQDDIREGIFGLAAANPDPPAWTHSATHLPGHPGVPTLFLSDIHYAEMVQPSIDNGQNWYNCSVAHERLRVAVEKTILLTKTCMRYEGDLPGIVLALGGDMISGNIHQELKETNERRIFPAILALRDILSEVVRTLRDEFRRVWVVGVIGNHARLEDKTPSKGPVETNADWLLYNLLERDWKRTDPTRVAFYVPNGLDASFAVCGHRYCLTHGESMGVRGGDGIIGPIGPIIRGSKKLHTQKEALGMPFDTLLVAHFHQIRFLHNDGVICNGSTVGYNEYAAKGRFTPGPAAQCLWFTHPDHGICWGQELKLTSQETHDAPTKEWVSWPADDGKVPF